MVYMEENDFLNKLQIRAREQRTIITHSPYPKVFLFVTDWLSNHPWRYLIPLAFLLSLLLRLIFGYGYINFVLWLFTRV